ncbi:hypothetical protein [Bacillus licheniformis]|nr:hypothetical protein [Bacillus licheniformis]
MQFIPSTFNAYKEKGTEISKTSPSSLSGDQLPK